MQQIMGQSLSWLEHHTGSVGVESSNLFCSTRFNEKAEVLALRPFRLSCFSSLFLPIIP